LGLFRCPCATAYRKHGYCDEMVMTRDDNPREIEKFCAECTERETQDALNTAIQFMEDSKYHEYDESEPEFQMLKELKRVQR